MEGIQIVDTSVLQNYSRAASGSQPRQFAGFGIQGGWNGASFASTDVRGAAHSAWTGRHSGVFRLPIGVGGEGGKRSGEVRLAATWTSNRIAITADQLLEFGSTILTNVFKDRHFTPSSFCLILAQRGAWWWVGFGAGLKPAAGRNACPAEQHSRNQNQADEGIGRGPGGRPTNGRRLQRFQV